MLALTGATIFASPTARAVKNSMVLIDGEKIIAVETADGRIVPDECRVIDCTGNTITAGFWNSHVHFFERKWADIPAIPPQELTAQLCDMSTRFGFTSVFDIGSMWENTRRLRDRIESGEVCGPRIYSTGEGLLPPNALPEEAVLRTMGVMNFPAPEISSASGAASAAARLIAAGVDAIKIFASSPRSEPLTEDAMRAAVVEAHRAEKPAFVHPNSADDVKRALNAGADVVAHTTPTSGAWSESLMKAANEHKAALTPTLMLWKQFLRHDRRSMQEPVRETAIAQLKAWREAGASVLFGTDLGAVDYDPTDEYLMMAQAGMGFEDILASLTTVPSERFSSPSQSGRIAADAQADLVVLKRDPLLDIAALSDVRFTLRAGRVVYSDAEEDAQRYA